jgi:hypothetical protein
MAHGCTPCVRWKVFAQMAQLCGIVRSEDFLVTTRLLQRMGALYVLPDEELMNMGPGDDTGKLCYRVSEAVMESGAATIFFGSAFLVEALRALFSVPLLPVRAGVITGHVELSQLKEVWPMPTFSPSIRLSVLRLLCSRYVICLHREGAIAFLPFRLPFHTKLEVDDHFKASSLSSRGVSVTSSPLTREYDLGGRDCAAVFTWLLMRLHMCTRLVKVWRDAVIFSLNENRLLLRCEKKHSILAMSVDSLSRQGAGRLFQIALLELTAVRWRCVVVRRKHVCCYMCVCVCVQVCVCAICLGVAV